MSAKQRADGSALQAKYARVFNVPIEDVVLELLEGDDAVVFHKNNNHLPRWSLGVTDSRRNR